MGGVWLRVGEIKNCKMIIGYEKKKMYFCFRFFYKIKRMEARTINKF